MPGGERVPIIRLGLVLDMADGSKVMIYSEDLPDASATITTETPTEAWGWPLMTRSAGRPMTSILLEGIGAHAIRFAEPGVKVSAPGRQLEAIRREVRP